MSEDQEKAKEANKFVNKAKSQAMMKDYDKSVSFYEKAIEIYDEIGYSFQIKRLQWEIDKLKNITIDAENVKADTLRRKASTQRMKEIAERRKLNSTQPPQNEKNSPVNSQKHDNGVMNNAPTRMNRNKADLKQFEKQKKERDDKFKEADAILDKAKKAAENLEFDTARKFYSDASDSFEKLGWTAQAIMIRKEIEVLNKKELILEDKKKREEEYKIKKQNEFDDKIRLDKEYQERMRKLKEEAAKKRTPAELKKIEMAEFNFNKAELALKKGKNKQALKRYKYTADIFEELDYNKEQLEYIQHKIRELEPIE
jgi:tetratricopeptide (TPR) repeat protein